MNKRNMLTLAVLIAILAGYCFRGPLLQALQDGANMPVKRKGFKVIAHRGASGYAPENTLPAFQKALDQGADWIELDLHSSKEGVPVVFHDATLERCTNGEGPVREAAWEDLAQLDAGSWYGEAFQGTKIPNLTEVLERVDGKAAVLIELKLDERGEIYEGLVERVLEDIEAADAQTWCILQAFDSRYLKKIKESGALLPYHKLIVEDYSPFPFYVDEKWQWGYLDTDLEYQAINPYYKTLTPGRIRDRHEEGYEVYPYTVNEESDMRMLLHWGVDGIITNYPDRALRLKL